MQSTYGVSISDNALLHSSLHDAKARVSELEAELREAETIRRKLHNTVQELKGNIRVFCRVRPILEADFARGGGLSSSGSASDVGGKSKDSNVVGDVGARWVFPDKMDKKEICVETLGENAEGRERRETFKFAFDKVGSSIHGPI